MARDLKFIKVRMLRGSDGKNQYPPFNDIPAVIRDDKDWSMFVDSAGIGWHYDQIDSFGEGAEPDQMFGMLGVPATFADEALARWPSLIVQMSEIEVADFWDNYAHVNEPSMHEDSDVLSAIASKRSMGMRLSTQDRSALDPDKATIGIRKNHKRTWARFKAKYDITVDETP